MIKRTTKEQRIKYLKNNDVTYEELMNMSDDNCIKIKRTYFYILLAKSENLEIVEDDFWEIFYKYIEISRMNDYISLIPNIITQYFLMSVKDVKKLLNETNDIPDTLGIFLKSDVKVEELEETHQNIREEYRRKKNPLVRRRKKNK